MLPRRSAKGEGEGDDNVDGAAAEEGEDVVHLVVDYLKTVKGRARQVSGNAHSILLAADRRVVERGWRARGIVTRHQT